MARKVGQMEGVELRARRLLLGLSTNEITDMLGVPAKVWRGWESGRRPVPDDTAEAVLDLCAKYAQRVCEATEAAEAAYAATGEPVPICAYKTIEAFEKAGGSERYGLPWSGHTMLAALTFWLAEADSIPVYMQGIHHADMKEGGAFHGLHEEPRGSGSGYYGGES